MEGEGIATLKILGTDVQSHGFNCIGWWSLESSVPQPGIWELYYPSGGGQAWTFH